MNSISRILQSNTQMLYASTGKGHAQRKEGVHGSETADMTPTSANFAGILAGETALSGEVNATSLTNNPGSDISSTQGKAAGANLFAVLEKLSARSELRPEVKGLQNAVQHIMENLERRGFTVPSSTIGDDASLAGSPTVEDEQATVSSTVEEPDATELSSVESSNLGESSSGEYAVT